MRIERILETNARKFPGRVVVANEGRQVTYREMETRASRLARGFRSIGLEAGDRILVALPNRIEFVESLFASAAASLVLVPVNPRISVNELAFILNHSGARAAILETPMALAIADLMPEWANGQRIITLGPNAGHSWIRPYEGILEDASDLILGGGDPSGYASWLLAYTSGTTGRPKGVVLSHRSKYLCSLIEAIEFGSSDRDIALMNTPMFHVHGIVHILSMAAVGGTMVLMDRFTPSRTLEWIDSMGITELAMVPTMFQAILDAPELPLTDFSSLRIARCTGAQLADDLKQRILEAMPGLKLHTLYGATEAGPISNLRPEHQASHQNSVGQPFLGVEIEIRDGAGNALPPEERGDVFIKSPYIFHHYHEAGSEIPGNEYERWITLGDTGSMDSGGFLYLHGRNKDLIITGGENVAAKEVEDALAAHPSIRGVAVLGIPDTYWGERIKAFVELKPGQSVSEPELLAFGERSLAHFKLPKEFEFVDALPRNAMGKVDKKKLIFAEGDPAQQESRDTND